MGLPAPADASGTPGPRRPPCRRPGDLTKKEKKKLFSKPPISDREPLQKTPDSNNRDTTVSEKTPTICTVPPNFNSDYYY